MVCVAVDVLMSDDNLAYAKPIRHLYDEYTKMLNSSKSHFSKIQDEITLDEFTKYLELAKNRYVTVLAIHKKDEQDYIGGPVALAKIIKRPENTCEVCIIVKEEERGKGIGTSVMNKLLQYAHNDLAYRTVFARSFGTDNEAAKFLKKCSFELHSMDCGVIHYRHNR